MPPLCGAEVPPVVAASGVVVAVVANVPWQMIHPCFQWTKERKECETWVLGLVEKDFRVQREKDAVVVAVAAVVVACILVGVMPSWMQTRASDGRG